MPTISVVHVLCWSIACTYLRDVGCSTYIPFCGRHVRRSPRPRVLRYSSVQVPSYGYSSMKLTRRIADIRDTISRYTKIGDSLMHKKDKTHEDSMTILRAYTYIETMMHNGKQQEGEQ